MVLGGCDLLILLKLLNGQGPFPLLQADSNGLCWVAYLVDFQIFCFPASLMSLVETVSLVSLARPQSCLTI